MAISKSDISGGLGGIGGAVSSYYNAQGNKALAAGYGASAELFDDAIRLARDNRDITKEATEIKLLQADRQIYKTISGQQADVAGAGFAASGTALDLLRDSTAQGELTMSLIRKQGEIDVNAYKAQMVSLEQQQSMALAQQSAANTAAKGSEISAVINGLSAAAFFLL